MCGIAGYRVRNDAGDFGSWLRAAIESMGRRGPDDRGFHLADGVGLGQARLSIIDLSPSGHQPMLRERDGLAITYNGEVYNYREIRDELTALGHSFSGGSDTEVVLAAFAQWGDRAVHKLVGMFAIALWNERTRTLKLIRDRLGVKPLHYGWSPEAVWFASELKGMRAFRQWTPEIDRQSLAEYLKYGYIADPATIYSGVFKVPPGHLVTFEEDAPPRVERYWSVLDHAGKRAGIEEAAADEELQALLDSAIGYRMVADVPVGVFLSGGIDSTLVAAVLARRLGYGIDTFTIGFGDSRFDESPAAKAVAHNLGTRHHELVLSERDALAVIPEWASLYDEPFGDSSGIPTYLVSKLAKATVKVAMSADGGDELFGGYTNYRDVPRHLEKLGTIPRALGVLAGASVFGQGLGAQLGGTVVSLLTGETPRSVDRFRKAAAAARDRSPARVFDLAISSWWGGELERLVGAEPRPRHALADYPGSFREQMMLWDLHHYLPGDILTKVDRATMATSLEGREPLLDHRLAEFAFSLPEHLRIGTLGSKHLLRKQLYRLVPRELIDRPKQGFGIPLAAWLRGALAPLVRELLSPSAIRRGGLLDPKLVDRHARGFLAGGPEDPTKLWYLLALQLWSQRWH